ncbi:50S ribosomal protein L3 [Candidatus Dojkabacteria bacterium]|uniref:Large ribosomal subunit protein uL3 n=1 Tax=Candidatus Dojkabacteria bacterium TaxID=2099670 RepID=A0A5C7JAY1_9BACT|nr:MAG: 50S ribosomal protein L3 [Candidatus Dojkabacteria bacterium]
MLALIGQKKDQSQRFLENGRRIPVTLIDVKDNVVVSIKSLEKDHYQAVQLGFGMKKKASKAELGHAKGAKRDAAPKFLREVRLADDEAAPEVGTAVNPSEVFTPGDIVNVSGVSKGKGFQGGVKRHGFAGGPKTHGQSDRHRAPGSIGQGTTPGRVYKGKRMAGRMGVDNVTVENLSVIDVTNDGVLIIKGLVPGVTNGLIYIKKVGEDKNFVPLQKTPEQLEAEEQARIAEESAAKEAEEKAKAEAEAQAAAAPAEEAPVEAEAVEAEPEVEAKEEVAAEVENSDEPKEGESSDAKAEDDK